MLILLSLYESFGDADYSLDILFPLWSNVARLNERTILNQTARNFEKAVNRNTLGNVNAFST